jgi:hypothetical protein
MTDGTMSRPARSTKSAAIEMPASGGFADMAKDRTGGLNVRSCEVMIKPADRS